jgi:hypothetical protein
MFNRGRKVADERGGKGERERCSRSIFHFNAAAALFAGVVRAKKDTVAEPVSAALAASQKWFDNW